jgi:hypothetical protein
MSFVDAVEFGIVYDGKGNPINGSFIEDETGERVFQKQGSQIPENFPILPSEPPPYK